ncbi:MAG: hypothetical protein JNK05_05650 [Myxococcales bacterium]|nr:hypothetical protein [Myxococcales bacterium]
MCPKRLLTPDQKFCIAGGTNWRDSDYLTAADDISRRYCALLGPIYNWQQTLTDTGTPRPRFMCFARADCNAQRTIERNTCYPSASIDPGHSETGNRYATASVGAASVKVSQRSNPSISLSVAANASASIDLSQSGRVIVSELVIDQVSPTTFMGTNIASTMARSSDVWIGLWNAATSRFEIDASTGQLQVRSSIGGAPFWNQYTTAGSPAPYIEQSGNALILHATVEDLSNDLSIQLDAVLTPTAPQPTALIHGSPTAVGAPIETECTGPSGASLTVTGTATSGQPSVAAHYSWMFVGADGNYTFTQNSPNITLQLPLEDANIPPRVLSLVSRRGDLIARDDIGVRAVDHTPPTVTQSAWKLDCGWGTSIADPIVNAPTACAAPRPSTSDLCSSVDYREILAVRVYDYPSNALLFEQHYTDGRQCFSPLAGRLDAQLSTVDYEIDYRVRDHWGNWSAPRRWRGWFYTAAASLQCSAPAQPVTISDSNI